MRYFKRFWTAFAALAWIGSNSASLALGAPRTYVFIVDCSKSMAEAPSSGGDDISTTSASEESRLDLVKGALKDVLTRLSSEGGQRVGLWFFGHRTAWAEGDDPELLVQTDYLEQTLGF